MDANNVGVLQWDGGGGGSLERKKKKKVHLFIWKWCGWGRKQEDGKMNSNETGKCKAYCFQIKKIKRKRN